LADQGGAGRTLDRALGHRSTASDFVADVKQLLSTFVLVGAVAQVFFFFLEDEEAAGVGVESFSELLIVHLGRLLDLEEFQLLAAVQIVAVLGHSGEDQHYGDLECVPH